MSQLNELMAQKAAIDERIAELRKTERAQAIAQCVALIRDHDLTSADLFGSAKAKQKAVVPARYRNPLTGETWSGRGRRPKWLDGDRAAYAI